MTISEIQHKLEKLANKEKAKVLQGFFKTGPGQYGEGDVFLGITVPLLRKLAKECRKTAVADSVALLRSKVHEQRVLALFLLVHAYAVGDECVKKKYLRSLSQEHALHQQLGPGRPFRAEYRREPSCGQEQETALCSRTLARSLEKTDRHPCHVPVHQAGRLCGRAGHRGDAEEGRPRPDP